MTGILPCLYCGEHHDNWEDCDFLPASPARAQRVDRERDVEAYLVQRVEELGGEVRKVKWIGRRSAPDRYILVPPRANAKRFMDAINPIIAWVELKAPGEKPEDHQLREHERMRKLGAQVVVLDSRDAIDKFLGV